MRPMRQREASSSWELLLLPTNSSWFLPSSCHVGLGGDGASKGSGRNLGPRDSNQPRKHSAGVVFFLAKGAG